MYKTNRFTFRLNDEQLDFLLQEASRNGFMTPAEYIRSILLKDFKPNETQPPVYDYRNFRLERKSFTIEPELWEKLEKLIGKKMSISSYIRQAIKEKLERS
jgi:hypothetical protein